MYDFANSHSNFTVYLSLMEEARMLEREINKMKFQVESESKELDKIPSEFSNNFLDEYLELSFIEAGITQYEVFVDDLYLLAKLFVSYELCNITLSEKFQECYDVMAEIQDQKSIKADIESLTSIIESNRIKYSDLFYK